MIGGETPSIFRLETFSRVEKHLNCGLTEKEWQEFV
jgi:hypothetical protein